MIPNRTDRLQRLHVKHIARPDNVLNTNGHDRGGAELSDEEVIELCRRAKNAAKFSDLFDHGDTSAYGGDDSRADQALISLMAFYTQDPEQLDKLFQDSALYRPEKWGRRPDYRRRTIEKALSGLTETYAGGAQLVTNGRRKPQSQSQSLYKGSGSGLKPEALRFSEMELPGPRRYLLKDLVLAAYVTLLYGDGGVAKSLLALALAVAISGDSRKWLGREVENCPVLYLDFELDAEEQARRGYQVCSGMGLERPPDDLFYMSALGFGARQAFEGALAVCEEHSIKLLIVDSYGIALQGDAEASRDVIGFHQQVVEPFRAKGIAVLIIDHQSRLQQGQSYQAKGAFGSVFKTNLARSVIQAEATERGEGTLTVRLRQKKHNFGPLAEPFGVRLTFSTEAVSLEALELEAAELAEEATLNATERVKLALESDPAYPWEIAAYTGIPLKTVRNVLTGLRKQGVVEPTGKIENRTEQVRLSVPQSRSQYRDWDQDRGGSDTGRSAQAGSGNDAAGPNALLWQEHAAEHEADLEKCIHGYPSGKGCYSCDPNHPYRLKEEVK